MARERGEKGVTVKRVTALHIIWSAARKGEVIPVDSNCKFSSAKQGNLDGPWTCN